MSTTLSRRDRVIPYYFVLFFVVIAIVDGIMVTLAVRTHTGIVTENAYEKGLAYNKVVAAANHQKALGLKMTLAFEGTAKAGTVKLTMADAQAAPLSGAKVELQITRPTQAGFDQTLTMVETEKGTYSVPAHLSMEGLWQLRAYIHHQGEALQYATRVVVAP